MRLEFRNPRKSIAGSNQIIGRRVQLALVDVLGAALVLHIVELYQKATAVPDDRQSNACLRISNAL